MKFKLKVNLNKYTNNGFFSKIALFFYYKIIDLYDLYKNGRQFEEYGVDFYCAEQGSGKTIGMVEYLERMRKKYPKVKIYTNFGYVHETEPFNDWNDFFEKRNGNDGVIFAIDEIQNEFSSTTWKNFPESLLSEITQQRKQKIKIICSSQVFTRVAKPLREQCSRVIECKTLAKRWTFLRCYKGTEYNNVIDRPSEKEKLRTLWRKSFIQDSNIRDLYDTEKKIERMQRTTFLERDKRLA